MHDADKAIKPLLYNIHKLTGLTLLTLAVLRVIWALTNVRPTLPSMPALLKHLAHGSHTLLYLLMLCMPISGWIMSCAAGYYPKLLGFTFALPIAKNKALADLAGDFHEVMAWTLVAVISIHILAALKHQLVDKDNVLMRMLRGK